MTTAVALAVLAIGILGCVVVAAVREPPDDTHADRVGPEE